MRRELFGSVKVKAYTSGEVIDRQNLLSAILSASISEVSGSPTEGKLSVAVTHCDTSDGTFEAVDDDRMFLEGNEFDIDVNSGLDRHIPIDMLGCKRFVKITLTATYTGGTTPSSTNKYALALGDSGEEPIT